MQVDTKIIEYMVECIRRVIESGLEEEPNKFKYTKYMINMMMELDINLKTLDEVIFNRILTEFISYLK